MTALAANKLSTHVALDAVKQAQVVTAEKQGKRAKDGERGINASPEKGYLADRASDEREKHDTDAAGQTEVNDPAIAIGIAIGAHE